MFNDVGEIELEVSSILSYVHMFTSSYDHVLTLMDCTIVAIVFICSIHLALVSFLPTLHHSVQYSGSTTTENDD